MKEKAAEKRCREPKSATSINPNDRDPSHRRVRPFATSFLYQQPLEMPVVRGVQLVKIVGVAQALSIAAL
ncbi:hypothetical protein [Allomesorhizobium camelthorni]|uniref:Uncharacterized protein n=1 Tax=Allomesorhizobium camelthorni TaxID=475069 RepID=A0A6G4WKI9_9HYPH|nr:hypothetical protein [Mesorhizobium camelthorni]NGO55281.1 hypothetical protein [Mesorhizobium camelthorni]